MENHTPESLLQRLLSVLDEDILPLTESGVAKGNKIFGAALLRKSDLSLVLAETNNEMENPLWHGEMHTLKRFYEIPADQRPDTSDLIFLSLMNRAACVCPQSPGAALITSTTFSVTRIHVTSLPYLMT